MAPTRTLLLGSGGREHALAWKLAAEPGVNEVVVAPGSEAIAEEPRVRRVADLDPLDGAAVVRLARSMSAELVVVGPEAPLAAGVADALRAAGFPVFGPSAAAARIETSKAFCHDVAAAAGVPMAEAFAFDALGPAVAYARELAGSKGGAVVKADGLAAGKGVTVCATEDEAEAALAALFDAARPPDGGGAEDARPLVVVEERLAGPEASVIAITDGEAILALPAARDHKRLLDGDRGPNTGGMGAYAPLPDLAGPAVADIVERIHRPILAELARRGMPYLGALYAGLMLTDRGPVLLECNARFGDPETQVILPLTGVAIGPLLLAAARGRLGDAARSARLDGPLLPAVAGAAVAIVLAAAGYPESPRRGATIGGLAAARDRGALVFHAGTSRDAAGQYRTAGGRVLTVVGRGDDLSAARATAEAAADAIVFEDCQRRHDIALDIPAAAAAGFLVEAAPAAVAAPAAPAAPTGPTAPPTAAAAGGRR